MSFDHKGGPQTDAPGSLEVTLPDGTRQSFPLGAAEIVLGRSPDCGLVLADHRVSRRHALLRLEAGAYVIEDQGSVNKVVVNGRQVQRRVLRHGDIITLGQCVLEVSLAAPAARSEGTMMLNLATGGTAEAKRPRPGRAASSGGRRRLLLVAGGAGLAALLLVALISLFTASPPAPEATPPVVSQAPAPASPQPSPTPPASTAPAGASATGPVYKPPAGYQPPAPAGQAPAAYQPGTPPPAAAQPAQSQAPSQARLYFDQGLIFYDGGRLPDAVAALGRAAALDPGNRLYQVKLQAARQDLLQRADDAFNRGMRNFQYLNYEQAVQDWIQVLYLVPDVNDPLNRKAREYLEQARLKLNR